MEGFMKYDVHTGSACMIYIPDFINTGSCVLRFTVEGVTQYGDHTSLLLKK
jgi:hypothetical protein